jgi:hypothetical protein
MAASTGILSLTLKRSHPRVSRISLLDQFGNLNREIPQPTARRNEYRRVRDSAAQSASASWSLGPEPEEVCGSTRGRDIHTRHLLRIDHAHSAVGRKENQEISPGRKEQVVRSNHL